MNQLFLVIVVLVAFTYFGGSPVPNVLKSNKQILLGVLIGLVLGSFFGVRVVEGKEPEGCAGDQAGSLTCLVSTIGWLL